MKRLSSYIPNIITCCNLTAGSLAVIMALRGTFEQAAIFILIAAVCDFLDGLSARLLHAYSDMYAREMSLRLWRRVPSGTPLL